MSFSRSRPRALARTVVAAGALFAGLVSSSHAVTFSEVGDAGQTVASAQYTTGAAGALTSITGSLGSMYDVDLFVINITSPGSFSATTTIGSSDLDTQIFLLTMTGAPIALNDDANGLTLLSTLPVGSFTLAAGNYILGVGEARNDPMNSASQLLFGNPTTTTGVNGPASGLQPAVLGGFSQQNDFVESGSYTLTLTGAAVAAVPEPSTYALMALGLGALGFAARRRRSA